MRALVFVSVVTEMDFANDGPRRPGEVGIDLGIAQTVTLSDGTVFQLDVESIKPENRGIYTQSDSPKKSSRNIWSLAVVSVDQRY